MKVSDLIKKLEILKEKHGDNELNFNVVDSYNRYGEAAEMMLIVGDEGSEMDWSGVNTVGNGTNIKLYLKDQSGKRPKITFRQ